jgi:acetylornithine deacetylase/succinyl-diaminopimelate desuccinylase-like protein
MDPVTHDHVPARSGDAVPSRTHPTGSEKIPGQALPPGPEATEEAIGLCHELIRLDTSNFGDGSGPGERLAAEYVAEKLTEVGLEVVVHEPAPRRTSVVARWPGVDPEREALLIHGHLDVVPAQAADWRQPPFAGEVAEDCLWGRGAVDMKDFDAMTLAVVRDRVRRGRPPARDVVLAFVADEEAGGQYGAQSLVTARPDLFEGCTEAIGEVGGYSFTVSEDRRLYLIETAQKGMAWLRLIADGTAGHGSMVNTDNAVTELAEAVGRLGRHRFPLRLTPTVREFLTIACAELGVPLDLDDPESVAGALGPVWRIVGATLRNTVQPTVLSAGYKANVIPGQASAQVDGRFLPGYEDEFFATVDELLGPRVRREFISNHVAVQTSFDGRLVEAIRASLLANDPGALAVPYLLSAGTDAKHFSTLGIRCFGFAPLRLPADLDFAGMFHGVDERVPLDALRFGVRVLDDFLDRC